ncbi:Siderophore synthetase component [Epibacterium ulvae]|uniref:Siderophore synthetase component n=1 Tax=Epibacterium ulvae TaxID=1156985 RepID=A0A1G5QUK1_9RHOB|nr:IucA/IucC family protein [Epibacterium ulvae]SCZ64759.1 Siderophore synthetase component [Epibacterium ulvae]
MSLHDQMTTVAQHRVLRQLCEALLCEGWASSLAVERDARLSWCFGTVQFRATGRLAAFGRYRIAQGSIVCQSQSQWQSANMDHVLDALDRPSDAKLSLKQDLVQTIWLSDINALALTSAHRRTGLPLDAMETALHEGHPYHPCFKARSGFSKADHLAYGPEFGHEFHLIAVLFNRDLVHESLRSTEFWPDELSTAGWQQLSTKIETLGLDLDRFSLLPVHPWQWQTLQSHPLLQTWLAKGQAIVLGPFGEAYRATQSVRTLMNATTPTRAHVKTAMAMRNTSSLRTLIPETVEIAPMISNWVAQVVASDPLFETHYPIAILPEYAGIIVGRDTELAGHLAAIWRQSPHQLGLPADQMLPFNALALTEEDGDPFIAPWLENHGVDRWVTQLIEVVVLPVWHLMVAHGIGLEAHGQNLILQHDKGWPIGLIARDFHDGVEYVPELLSRPDLCPDLGAINPVFDSAPLDKFHKLSSVDGLRELVMDTLFVFNLADVSDLLHQRFGFSETQFWDRVQKRLHRYAQEHNLTDRQALFDPFKRQIHAESLITRKLDPGRDLYRHLITNSLSTTKEH